MNLIVCDVKVGFPVCTEWRRSKATMIRQMFTRQAHDQEQNEIDQQDANSVRVRPFGEISSTLSRHTSPSRALRPRGDMIKIQVNESSILFDLCSIAQHWK